MTIKKILKKIITLDLRNKMVAQKPKMFFKKTSYAQCGEDLIIKFIHEAVFGFAPKKYVDIGAHHPYYISNTALFYQEGGSGTVIEPDPYYARLLKRRRARDTVIEAGVHISGASCADFYIFDTPTLNTFSAEEADRYSKMGHRLTKVKPTKLIGVNDILSQVKGDIDLLNIDVEGLDTLIVKAIDWDRYRPHCVCVESAAYDMRAEPKKTLEIIEFLKQKNYFLYADTFNNSIFIEKSHWDAHWGRQSVRNGQDLIVCSAE